ncbi:replication initiation protein, partial [Bifidobacterium thermophilum]|nr:replication initiation protein [Bifidobacterium thermophilum]
PANQPLEVSVNDRFAFLLTDLTSQFTRFELAEFADLKSKYAKEFYRRAKQYRSSGIWKVSRDEFCRLLNVS